MKIVVLGSIVMDEIHPLSGQVVRSFGGVTYSIMTIAKFLPDAEIVPITWVGKDEFQEFVNLLKKFPNISTNTLLEDPNGTNTNILEYINEQDRLEFFQIKTSPIPWDAIKPHIDDSDAFLINFITPKDLEFETAKSLSMAFREFIYADIHSLLRIPDDNGQFRLRHIPEWQNWASFFDAVQMNVDELSAFTGFNLNELWEIQMATKMVLFAGPRIANITFADKGSLLGVRNGREVNFTLIENPLHKPKDPTGCGDVFGASFLADYIKNKDPLRAAKFANKMAMKKAISKSFMEFLGLE